MKWLTRDYVCTNCARGKFDVLLHLEDGAPAPDTYTCDCGATAQYSPSFGATFRVALPDGSKRFQDIRTARTLQKAEKKAKRQGRKDEVAKIKAETKKLKST